MTTLGDALQKALDAKKNDFSDFIWKNEKKRTGDKLVQESKRMIDMSQDELQKCLDRCNLMLHNNNTKNLGRFNVLDEVNEQINKCNVELLLRYYENSYKHDASRGAIPRNTLNLDLRKLKANNPEIEDWSIVPITHVTSGLPAEFNNVNISDILDGCLYCLGAFDKKHLTLTFITKLGLWFTKAEELELKGKTNSNTEKLKVAKERLRLPEKLILKFSEKGLSYHEMRAILNLPKKQRYNDMTTEQLVTLRDKILPRFQKQVDSHIYSWNRLKRQIKLVAKEKGFELNDEN